MLLRTSSKGLLAIKLAIAPSACLGLALLLIACLVPGPTVPVLTANNLMDNSTSTGQVILSGAGACHRAHPEGYWYCKDLAFGSYNLSITDEGLPAYAKEFTQTVGSFRAGLPAVGIAYAIGAVVFALLLFTTALIAHFSGSMFYDKHLHIYRPLYLKCFAILNAYCVGLSGFAFVQCLQITQATSNFKDTHQHVSYTFGAGYSFVILSLVFHLVALVLTFLVSALGRIHLRHPAHILKLVADVQADHQRAYYRQVTKNRAQSRKRSDSNATLVEDRSDLINKTHKNWDSLEAAQDHDLMSLEKNSQNSETTSASGGKPTRVRNTWIKQRLSTSPDDMTTAPDDPASQVGQAKPASEAQSPTPVLRAPVPLQITKKTDKTYDSSGASASQIVNESLRQASLRANRPRHSVMQNDRSSVHSNTSALSANSMLSGVSARSDPRSAWSGHWTPPRPDRTHRRQQKQTTSPIAEMSEPPTPGFQGARVPPPYSPTGVPDDDDDGLFSDVGIPERI